ncbi:hypothetical protein J113_08030 [Mycobacterium tuberculosis CAS/NITR204]|uniref:Methyltransferase type 11 domain-containing protein n=1 Tax=Mycobacterium tuberculosis CAS/NITR204 TaxID=1310114 RepID=R4MC21_MYCTX|nr:hypothetical protein J113_08030 [Mycobacterium tuberculosis CAS/NITR204]
MTSGAAASASRVDHPLFARIWPVVAAHEAEAIRALRRENLAGLSGRVLEVGAGVGTNFAYYPVAVEQVIAMEPEPRLAAKARIAAADAPVPIVVTDKTARSSATRSSRAVVCSLVLCSVSDPGAVLAHCVRYYGEAGSCAISSMWPAPALGAGCSGSSTRHFGPGWRATVTRIAIPNARSSTPDSWWTAPGGSGHFPPGCRYRCQSWLWAARTGPSYS